LHDFKGHDKGVGELLIDLAVDDLFEDAGALCILARVLQGLVISAQLRVFNLSSHGEVVA